MKKSFLILSLFLCVLLCLSACGKTESASQPEPTPTPTVPVLESVLPGGNLSTDAPEVPEENQIVIDSELIAAAQACIGKSVDELYEAIGEPPMGSDYAPSCMGVEKGGEDGELYYDGFTVATYREGDSETVSDVTVNINVG